MELMTLLSTYAALLVVAHVQYTCHTYTTAICSAYSDA